jgi:hypothetical protein
MTNRARAVDDDAVADAVAAAADAAKKAATVRCRDGPVMNRPPTAGLPTRMNTTALTNREMGDWTDRRNAPRLMMTQSPKTAAGSTGNRLATATRRERRAGDDDGAAAVAADGAGATAKAARARPASSPNVTAASHNGMSAMGPPDLRKRMPMTTNRCRLAMGGGLLHDRPAREVGWRRPGRNPGKTGASLQAQPVLKTANRANPAAVAAAGADVAKDAVAMPAARQHRPRVAASHVVRAMEAAAVAAVEAGARAKNGVRHRPSIEVAATNSPRWREDARKTTRGWSSSVSRMPATMATVATTAIRRMTTASSRVASMKCSMCRVGWRRSASSSPAISTLAAGHPEGVTLAVVANSRVAMRRRGAAHPTGLAIPDVAAARVAVNADRQLARRFGLTIVVVEVRGLVAARFQRAESASTQWAS